MDAYYFKVFWGRILMATNKEFSNDRYFVHCCEKSDIKPTIRQASKFKQKRGTAYKTHLKLTHQKI